MLICKEKTQHLMQKNNEALMQYVEDIKNLRNLILSDLNTEQVASSQSQPSQSQHNNATSNNGNSLSSGQQPNNNNNAGFGSGMVSAVTGVGQQQTPDAVGVNSSNNGGAGSSQGSISTNREAILRKALKCKQLEDDNKKLRKLLKNQIEGSDKLRQDTQNTITTLREEFDVLLKELTQYKQKEELQHRQAQSVTG
mmetsp:Transcript_12911/g.21844  ORF Transcript_12911/g.21844 Transcript_12911/m.21844 type:complete len:196 (+) Transcript_12911:397-984(+)